MKIVGLTGMSGSGKTYVLNQIKEQMGSMVSVLSIDNYYKKIEEQEKDINGVENFDLPSAIDHLKLIKDILHLKNGNTLVFPIYQFNNPTKGVEYMNLEPKPLLIVEGIFACYYPELNELVDYSVFIDAEINLTYKRRIQRDITDRNLTVEMVAYQWNNHVLPSYEKYILPFKSKVDFVFVNDGNNKNSIKDLIKSLNQLILKHD